MPPDQVLRIHPTRFTDAQWAKVILLGGAAWLRKMVDKAKVKP